MRIPSKEGSSLAPTGQVLLWSALMSPPALDESGREEPRRKTSWVLKVDDGDHGGDGADDIDGPFVGCSRHTT